MRCSFVYYVFHLSISELLTAAMDPGWTYGTQMRRPFNFDLNTLPQPEPEENITRCPNLSRFSSSGNYGDEPLEGNRFQTSSPGKRIPTDPNKSSTSKRPKEGKLSGHLDPVVGDKNKEQVDHLEISKKNRFFNVNDWSFLRIDPKDEVTAQRQNKFLRFLHESKSDKAMEGFFFIEKTKANSFMKRYRDLRRYSAFTIPPEIKSDYKNIQSYEILRQISDKTFDLDSNIFFSQEIMRPMKERIQENYRVAKNKTPSDDTKKTKNMEELVERVTKVTHLLMIAVLSLYKEHKKNFVAEDEVVKQLNFIKQLWFRLEEGTFEEENGWKREHHKILKFQSKKKTPDRGDRYTLSWKFVNSWLEENGMALNKRGQGFHTDTLTEIINKIIFFSNYQHMMDNIPKEN
jgi:hypothetical protein